jgi:hypothetical protein
MHIDLSVPIWTIEHVDTLDECTAVKTPFQAAEPLSHAYALTAG